MHTHASTHARTHTLLDARAHAHHVHREGHTHTEGGGQTLRGDTLSGVLSCVRFLLCVVLPCLDVTQVPAVVCDWYDR
jgi:hypothetical protein